MRSFDLEELEIFRAVVSEGGVLRAAARLNRVQSNVTTRIRQMEQRLGVLLFRRRGRGLDLTAEGQKLLSYAERLLRLADEAALAMRDKRPLGRLRLGSMESAAGARLPPVLARYHQLYPDVAVELTTAPSLDLIQRVQKFEIDAAFVSEPFTAAGLESAPVFQEELVLIAPVSQSLEAATMTARRTVIAFTRGCSYRRRLEDWLSSIAMTPDRVLELASYHAIVACVTAGSGAAIIPKSILIGLPFANHLSTHPLPANIAANQTHLIWRAPMSPAISALLQLFGE